MPIIHASTGALVVRIVYDGPPMSGKTTTLRALATQLKTNGLVTPAEAKGRTLFFDWVEFVGGVYDGRKIHCQIVSVPGQTELRHRREHLLAAADAVVFVADTRDGHFQPALTLLDDLVGRARAADPPVGLVFQANKRDAPDAMDVSVLKGVLWKRCPMPFIDSIASNGDGVREAFVFAVRLAVDRARALAARGMLALGEPKDNRPEELLAEMQGLERHQHPSDSTGMGPTQETLGELDRLVPEASTRPSAWAPGEERLLRPKDPLPSGHIWPPVDGRAMLHDAASVPVVPVRTMAGDWWASTGGWRFHSASAALYADHFEARRQLAEWANLHRKHENLLSPGRVLILADAGQGMHRLWQLVRVQHSLRERLLRNDVPPQFLGRELCAIGTQLLRARELLTRAEIALRCSLWTVSADTDASPCFVGLMPDPSGTFAREPEGEALLARELTPQLLELRQRSDYAALLASLRNESSEAASMLAHLAERASQ